MPGALRNISGVSVKTGVFTAKEEYESLADKIGMFMEATILVKSHVLGNRHEMFLTCARIVEADEWGVAEMLVSLAVIPTRCYPYTIIN